MSKETRDPNQPSYGPSYGPKTKAKAKRPPRQSRFPEYYIVLDPNTEGRREVRGEETGQGPNGRWSYAIHPDIAYLRWTDRHEYVMVRWNGDCVAPKTEKFTYFGQQLMVTAGGAKLVSADEAETFRTLGKGH